MAEQILVTGGTGTVGRLVVARLRARDRRVRVLSRRDRENQPGIDFVVGDLVTGTGVAAALEGCATVVHCASDRKGDVTAARNLVAAALARQAPPHVVFVSVVGDDRISFGYFREKRESERVITASGLPWSLVRATQFYDFILAGAKGLARLPIVPAPAGFRVRPVDPRDVADRLVELALDAPAGRVPDLAGPQESTFADLVRDYLRHVGSRRPVVPIWLPGLRAIRAGALLPDPTTATIARRSWAGFLSAHTGRP
jgi:uncharacterized protein YbjT (DUF2867 family)